MFTIGHSIRFAELADVTAYLLLHDFQDDQIDAIGSSALQVKVTLLRRPPRQARP